VLRGRLPERTRVTHRITDEHLSRRTVAGLATAAGLSLPVLASCGGQKDPRSEVVPSDDLGSTSQIEVGGGVVFADQRIVVTQPTKGDFKAFDATCTHQGCLVGSVSGGTINCPCHGSHFSITDGSPQSGPARSPLKETAIIIEGDQIKLA
jgi:Rieske Fe-S protein